MFINTPCSSQMLKQTLRTHSWAWLCTLCLACLTFLPAQANQLNDSAPAFLKQELGENRLVLRGSGSFRWFGLKIYDAALWGDPRQSDQPFALRLTYARNLDGKKIAETSFEEIERMQLGTPSQRQQWLRDMQGLFPDVTPGDAIVGVSQPNHGARFYLNGKLLGTIADPAFAQAFFAIWLDPRTRAPNLRAALLSLP